MISQSTSRGVGFRNYGGGSMTKMSRSYMTQSVRPSGAGSTSSYYKARQKFYPGAALSKKLSPPQFYHFNESQRLNGAFGVQAYSHRDVGSIFDLRNMIIQISGYNSTTEAFLHSINSEITFTNMNESTCYLDLYEVEPRYSFSTAIDPGTAWNNGLIDAGLSTGASTLHSVPTMSSAFTTLWKIKKKFKIELAQGQSHRHTAQYQLGYKWCEQLYNTMGANNFFPRTSRALLYCTYGAPVNDEAKTNVSTSTTNLDIVQKSRFTFYYNNPTNSKYTFVNSLPTITAGYTLDIGSGERDEVGSA